MHGRGYISHFRICLYTIQCTILFLISPEKYTKLYYISHIWHILEQKLYLLPFGECQGSCRLNYVMIPPIDAAAALAASMSGDANLRLVMSVPRCSLRRRSGARQPRHARARQHAARGSAPLISCVARRGLGAARSGRDSRLADRTGKLDL